jgi:hypothetical protein
MDFALLYLHTTLFMCKKLAHISGLCKSFYLLHVWVSHASAEQLCFILQCSGQGRADTGRPGPNPLYNCQNVQLLKCLTTKISY